MKFHEDTIFKTHGQEYGQELMEILKIKGTITRIHKTEYAIIDPKMYKPDLVFELEDKVVIFEFQSTYVDVSDKRRFRFYTALFDHIEIKSKKPIEVHVLSTVEREKTKWYHVNPDSLFPIYVHSLKSYDGDKFLNMMKSKIESKEKLNEKELLMLSLLCFMDTDKDMEQCILDSAVTITSISNINEHISQFVKGVVLMLCDKFVKDELVNKEISNRVGGKMKIIEDYADRVAKERVAKATEEVTNEKNKEFIINMDKAGYNIKEIAKVTNLDTNFIRQTLAK